VTGVRCVLWKSGPVTHEPEQERGDKSEIGREMAQIDIRIECVDLHMSEDLMFPSFTKQLHVEEIKNPHKVRSWMVTVVNSMKLNEIPQNNSGLTCTHTKQFCGPQRSNVPNPKIKVYLHACFKPALAHHIRSCDTNRECRVLPNDAGLFSTTTPALSRAEIFESAPPLPPLTMAPA